MDIIPIPISQQMSHDLTIFGADGFVDALQERESNKKEMFKHTTNFNGYKLLTDLVNEL